MRKLFLLIVVISLSACASIVSKSSYPLSIGVNPPGTNIIVRKIDKAGEKIIFEGQSPAAVRLGASSGYFKKASYSVELSFPGYQKKVIPVSFKLDGWYWGNVLFGGLIGWLIVDPLTGAMYKIDSDVILETLNKTTAYHAPELKILDYSSLDDDLRDALVELK